MGPRKLFFVKNGEQEDKKQTLDVADGELSEEETGSDSDSEGGGTALLPLKKPKFGASRDLVGLEPGENGSACSSPTVSGFIIMPAVKSSGKKKMKAPTSKKFSDEDEIALLKGLAVFWANGRNNKWAEFHKCIKDNLTNQFTKIQVSEKIRAFKRKFETNFGKARANGGRLDFSDSHESVLFELSKPLWGDDEGIAQENKKEAEIEHEESNKQSRKRKQLDEHNEVNKKSRKRKQVEENNISEQEKEMDEHHHQENDIPEDRKQEDVGEGEGEGNEEPEKGKQVTEIDREDFQSAFPLLYASFGMFGYPRIVKEKCVLIPREKAQELEEKWRELNADAARLELKKIELIKRDLQDRLERK